MGPILMGGHVPAGIGKMVAEIPLEVPLTRGRVAIIELRDSDLMGRKWHVRRCGERHLYATRYSGTGRSNRASTSMHREIAERAFGPLGNLVVDHINGDTLDNRRANLRAVTRTLNQQNVAGPRRDSKSGVLGVRWEARHCRWHAAIGAAGISHYLGSFKTIEEAMAARLAAERRLWGVQPRRAGVHQ